MGEMELSMEYRKFGCSLQKPLLTEGHTKAGTTNHELLLQGDEPGDEERQVLSKLGRQSEAL